MSTEHKIQNPVIPGFYPDPSICRVGDDFYLACSSFELYPGIPIFHSRDLCNWEQISYAMTMENGFHVNASMGTGGVMAPTIRWHEGTFYIINCNFGDKGNFYVTAKDPKGPWSSPHWITDIPDIDCSLFFDTDGKSYLVSPGDDPSEDNHRAFFLTPYDLEAGKVCGERKKIWNSALRCAWAPEAPHIYHIGEYYYLLIAEGGTEHFHSVMIARSDTVDGWYEGYKGNPIMTHRHLGYYYPIDNIGHADLVDTPDGKWYAVMLGSRILDGQHKNFGRETFLCPVEWERGWPVFSPGTGKMEWEYPAPENLPWTPYPPEAERDDFDSPEFPLHLSFWGVPYQDFWKVENSRLYLTCLKRPMAEQLKGFDVANPDQRRDNCISFLGRRQRKPDFDVNFAMEFTPEKNEAAGLLIMQAANHQFRLEKLLEDGKQVLRLIRLTTWQKGLPFLPGYEAKTTETVLETHPVGDGELKVSVKFRRQRINFTYCEGDGPEQAFEVTADGAEINPEEIGGMIGTMIGLFATANGEESRNQAAFDYFEMR
ncbi:MAG: glycoside hydrolase family 43 protein [Blautia sp.]|nr:glycoside hydrolase family 43 protein [Blautia sp.]